MHILLIDDQKEVRSALRLRLLGLFPTARVMECTTLPEAASLPARTAPDLILVDGDLPGLRDNLSAGLGYLHTIFPSATLLTMRSDPATEAEVLRAGAHGFLCKSDPPEVFAQRVAQSRSTPPTDPSRH